MVRVPTNATRVGAVVDSSLRLVAKALERQIEGALMRGQRALLYGLSQRRAHPC